MVVMDGYSDLHRAVLQTLMNHSTLEEKKLESTFEKICEKFDNDQQSLEQVIELINDKIGQFDQRIIKQQYGLNLENYYMFCSTAKTSVSKMQHCFTEHELEFFRSIFSDIVQNADLNITPREALNMTGGKLSKVRAEKLIEIWCTNGYFVREANLIYLGPKSLAEFKEELKKMQVEHLKVCTLCDDIAAWGVACGSCKTANYHKNCIGKFLARSDKCPSCKAKWTIPLEE